MKRTELKRTGTLKRRSRSPSDRGHPRPPLPPALPICYFAVFGHMEPWADGTVPPMPPCDGALVKCHLIKRTVLRKAGCGRRAEWASAAWVWGCGGPMGNGGHHGMFDFTRTLKLPRAALPTETEALALELGLSWYLESEYGSLENDASLTT